MIRHAILFTLTGMMLTACSAQSQHVEIYLADLLDNTQNGYCIDIGGGKGAQANPDRGLQGHTCYSPGGQLGIDQTFDADKFAMGILYMPDFDVCVEVSATDAGTPIDLAECDGSDVQTFAFSGKGTISPVSAPTMCFTVGEDTRSGRSAVNQIKVLSLESCAEEKASYQTWHVRSSSE